MDIVPGGVAVGSLNRLPPGHYLIMAKAQLDLEEDMEATRVECTLLVTDLLNAAGPFTDLAAVTLPSPVATPGEAVATLPLLAAADLPSGGDAVLTCGAENTTASNVRLTAIQVGSLTMQ